MLKVDDVHGPKLCVSDFVSGTTSASWQVWPSGRVTSVGGSAMHTKCPDDIGREAGIRKIQNRKELSDSGLARVDRPSGG